MRDFTKYDVWNNSVALAVELYHATRKFPDSEKFGLISQIRRSSVSIPSNFAEGCSRSSEKDFRRFIEIALGSAFELKTQLIIATKLSLIEAMKSNSIIDKLEIISKQLNALRKKLK